MGFFFNYAGGLVLEVCLAKYWAHLGEVEASYSVTFHGIQCDTSELVLHGAHSFTRLNLTGAIGNEEVRISKNSE